MPAESPNAKRQKRLRREVISPIHQVPGTGLLFASAMLFALAGSVLALRTHATVHRARTVAPPVRVAPAPATPQLWPADHHKRASAKPTCGVAQYHPNPDGTTSVVFEMCPEDAAKSAQKTGCSHR